MQQLGCSACLDSLSERRHHFDLRAVTPALTRRRLRMGP